MQYKGKNISEVLDMTVEHAYEFFSAVPVIARKLKTLLDVGLGYIRLGQSATTLSGGEAQRVKLSLELQARHRPHAVHPRRADHRPALPRHRPAAGSDPPAARPGNTVVIIEHNLDVIKTADWVIDLGPEGGAGGGQIIAQGTPEQVAKTKASFTGNTSRRCSSARPARSRPADASRLPPPARPPGRAPFRPAEPAPSFSPPAPAPRCGP